MLTSTGALIAAGVIGAAGAAGSAMKRQQGIDTQNAFYDRAADLLNSQYYIDPLTTVGNRSLIKQAKQAHEDDIEALQNRAVAGGATMENALAMRQKSNESMDKLYGTLLQGEDVRRRGIDNQKLQLAGQRANMESNAYYQAAQDWAQWGAAGAQAALSLGATDLLGGYGAAAPDADALAQGLATRTIWDESGLNQPLKGLRLGQEIKVNNAAPGIPVPKMGLAGR